MFLHMEEPSELVDQPPRTDGTFSPPRTPVSPALLVGAIHPPAGVPARLPGPSSVPGGAGLEREKGGLRGLRVQRKPGQRHLIQLF